MTDTADTQIMDTEAQIDFAVANAPDRPSCGRTSDTHVVRQGNDALRGDGIYMRGVRDLHRRAYRTSRSTPSY